jgi:hypothetical protein
MSQTESPSERVKRAAGALQSDEPQLNELWAAMRLAREHVVDLAPVIEVLVQNGPRWNIDHDQRVVLYELLAQDTAVVGQPVDKSASPIPEWGPLPETVDPTMQAVMESARQAVDSQLRFRNRVLDEKNRYFAFSPAWEVEGLLSLVFGPDDPATVIAEHLRTLFDVRRLADEPAGVYLQAASATENVSAALTHLIGIALRAADLSVSEKSVLSFMEDLRRDCWKLTGADRAAQLLIVIGASLQADQILFVAFLNTLIGHLVDFTAATEDPQRDASEALYRTAIQLLFMFSTPETEGTTPRLLIEAPESRTLPTHLSQIVETFDGLVEQLAAREEGRPFLPPQLLPHLLQLHGVFEYLHEEDTELFLEHIRFGVQYRSDALRGYAQYELNGGYLLQDVLATHRLDATREDDLTYQLGQVWLEYTDPDGSVLTYLPLWRGYREYSTPDTEKRRAGEFRALVRSAIAEGFPRLAEALAAFFVFSQSLRYQGRLEPWEVVSEIIASVSRVAEPRHLPAALTFAHEMASHHGERLLLLRIPDRAPRTYDYASIAGNLPGIGFAQREIVIKEVLELIGPGRRSILTDEGFDLLVDAHYKLSKLHRELIFGVLGNWGGIALDFAKVFEVELTSALGAIIRDPAYRQFKASRAKGRSPPVRPTLGSFLHLLREYAELPIPLQVQLDSTSELHGNPQLLTRLEKIINEHRNPAAHAAGYGPRKLQELLDLLYGHQVLPEFIDSLKRQGRNGTP